MKLWSDFCLIKDVDNLGRFLLIEWANLDPVLKSLPLDESLDHRFHLEPLGFLVLSGLLDGLRPLLDMTQLGHWFLVDFYYELFYHWIAFNVLLKQLFSYKLLIYK